MHLLHLLVRKVHEVHRDNLELSSPELSSWVRNQTVKTFNVKIVEVNDVEPEHEVSGLVHALAVYLSVDLCEHLFSDWSVGFVKFRFFKWIAVLYTPCVNISDIAQDFCF